MFGSKIDNLKKLKEYGFNVLPFEFVLFDEVFNDAQKFDEVYLNNKNLSSKELSILLQNLVEENINLENLNVGLDFERYAIRSSANIEDGVFDSFAGQFDTYLNVNKKDVNKKIIDCFKSLFNENVLDYIKNKKITVSKLRMNIIIERMLNSELSGVIFTANPQGILNESVIVVGKGLGENIVSDKVKTTSYYYNLTDKVYYYEGENSYLSHMQVENLINISQKICELFGNYLDIEFGIAEDKIYILQARKITTLTGDTPLILDNSNIVESYPGISLPLTISFVKSVYSGVFKGVCRRVLKNEKELEKQKETFENMIGSSNGRIYYKISNWYTLIKFLPANKKIIPIWQEMLGVNNKSYDESSVKLSPFRRGMTYVNAVYEFAATPKNMKKLNENFLKINDEFYNSINDEMHEKEILALYDKVETELLSSWDVTLLNDMYAFIYTGLLKFSLKKKYENYEEKTNAYMAGITNIESLKPIRALINLAYEKDNMSEDEYNEKFNKYIQEYGDRNLEELKLESLTFRTNPELLEDKINDYRKDLQKLKEQYDTVNKGKLVINSEENFIIKNYIKECTEGIKNREISRLNRSRIYGIVRKMFLQLGKIYCKQNLIEDERDIFYLEISEVRKLSDEKNDMKEIVKIRKAEYQMYELLPAYSRIIFENKEFNKSHSSINKHKMRLDCNELKGIPCSNGIVKGEALIIDDISKVGDVKDKILITKMTDPGWVFLLATAKGVISEKGSLLSHTAIISRELKIPSIVGVNKLLETIKNGDIIEMDGTTGYVKIIEKKES